MCRSWSGCVFCAQSSLIMIRRMEERVTRSTGSESRVMLFFSLRSLVGFTHHLSADIWDGLPICASLSRPRTLTPNKWRHRMDLDVRSWKGDGWGVKPLGCKIALAAMLLFQQFTASCLLPSSHPRFLSSFSLSFLHTGLPLYKAITDRLVSHALRRGATTRPLELSRCYTCKREGVSYITVAPPCSLTLICTNLPDDMHQMHMILLLCEKSRGK